MVLVVPSFGRGKMATGRWFNTSTRRTVELMFPESSVAKIVIFFQPGVCQAGVGFSSVVWLLKNGDDNVTIPPSKLTFSSNDHCVVTIVPSSSVNTVGRWRGVNVDVCKSSNQTCRGTRFITNIVTDMLDICVPSLTCSVKL